MSRKSFWSCRSGNVGLLFALAIVPVVASIGLAIDYSTAVGARYRLQNAIDATALSLAHARIDLTDAELQARAKIVFAQNFGNDAYTTLGPIIVVRGTDFITVDASAQTKTTFSRVLNINTLDVASAGKVVWGPVRVEVVMALDNTGSMDGTKLKELKKAAIALVDTLEEVESKPGDVKIGLVPFATEVRVDPGTYKTEDWIRFSTVVTPNCRYNKKGNWVCNPTSSDFNKNNWKGCIEDRDHNYDTKDGLDGTNASLYPAVQICDSGEDNLSVVRPLAWDFANIRTAINAMTAVGNTNVTIGAAMGMALLSHQAPFDEGVNPANSSSEGKTEKVLILLTDGDNTENSETRYYDAYHENKLTLSQKKAMIDPRTELACAEAKKVSTVYAIRVINGNESLLKKCASDTTKYYNVQDASQLVPVFKAIADEISKLRVAS